MSYQAKASGSDGPATAIRPQVSLRQQLLNHRRGAFESVPGHDPVFPTADVVVEQPLDFEQIVD